MRPPVFTPMTDEEMAAAVAEMEAAFMRAVEAIRQANETMSKVVEACFFSPKIGRPVVAAQKRYKAYRRRYTNRRKGNNARGPPGESWLLTVIMIFSYSGELRTK